MTASSLVTAVPWLPRCRSGGRVLPGAIHAGHARHTAVPQLSAPRGASDASPAPWAGPGEHHAAAVRHRVISNSRPGLITVPGARGAPAYQAARCRLWMVERRGCLAARGGLVRLPAAMARCVPGDAAAMHPIPGGRPLTRGGQRPNHRLHGAESGTACGQSSSGRGRPGCTPRSRWRGAGNRSRLSIATGLGVPPAPA